MYCFLEGFHCQIDLIAWSPGAFKLLAFALLRLRPLFTPFPGLGAIRPYVLYPERVLCRRSWTFFYEAVAWWWHPRHFDIWENQSCCKSCEQKPAREKQTVALVQAIGGNIVRKVRALLTAGQTLYSNTLRDGLPPLM